MRWDYIGSELEHIQGSGGLCWTEAFVPWLIFHGTLKMVCTVPQCTQLCRMIASHGICVLKMFAVCRVLIISVLALLLGLEGMTQREVRNLVLFTVSEKTPSKCIKLSGLHWLGHVCFKSTSAVSCHFPHFPWSIRSPVEAKISICRTEWEMVQDKLGALRPWG